MNYNLFNKNNYLTLLKFLYKYDDKLTNNYSNLDLISISSQLYKLFPTGMDSSEFYNAQFINLSNTYWDGGGNNYNTHFEADDSVIGPEDIFIDEISSLIGCFPSNHYQNFYYMFGSGDTKYFFVDRDEKDLTRIDLLNVIHHLIATYDFFKPFGYSLSYFNNSKESQNIKLINETAIKTINDISNYVNNNRDEFNEYDGDGNKLFKFVSDFNKKCLKSYESLNN